MSIVDNNEQEIMDIDLSPIRRRKFRIDGDGNRLLELNTTDLGIVTRLNETYPRLQELQNQYSSLQVSLDEEGNVTDGSFNAMAEAVKDLDTKMRDHIDYIFDSDVSAKCAPSGTMFDPIRGSLRFEFIIDTLSKLYEEEISKNLQKRKDTMSKHTTKYKKSARKRLVKDQEKDEE